MFYVSATEIEERERLRLVNEHLKAKLNWARVISNQIFLTFQHQKIMQIVTAFSLINSISSATDMIWIQNGKFKFPKFFILNKFLFITN